MKKITEITDFTKTKQRQWSLVDVKGKVLGRILPEIALKLQGKHRTNFAPNLDTGDNVIVINAKQVVVTGKKAKTKVYTHYSGYPGGLRQKTFAEMQANSPEQIIKLGVSGMLPKNKLRAKRLARLFIYKDDKHPYADKLS